MFDPPLDKNFIYYKVYETTPPAPLSKVDRFGNYSLIDTYSDLQIPNDVYIHNVMKYLDPRECGYITQHFNPVTTMLTMYVRRDAVGLTTHARLNIIICGSNCTIFDSSIVQFPMLIKTIHIDKIIEDLNNHHYVIMRIFTARSVNYAIDVSWQCGNKRHAATYHFRPTDFDNVSRQIENIITLYKDGLFPPLRKYTMII